MRVGDGRTRATFRPVRDGLGQVVEASELVFGEVGFGEFLVDRLFQAFQRPHKTLLSTWACWDVEADRLSMSLDRENLIAGEILRRVVAEVADTHPFHGAPPL